MRTSFSCSSNLTRFFNSRSSACPADSEAAYHQSQNATLAFP